VRSFNSSAASGGLRLIVALGLLAGGSLFASPAATRHFWDFEGPQPFHDKVGGAHAEVTPATTVTLVSGHDGVGQSMRTRASISGNNDFARISDGTKLAVAGIDPFSMSGWFRMPAATANNRGIFDFSGNGLDGPQMLLTGANALNFRVDGQGTYFLVASIAGAAVEDDQWHFFAAVYDPALDTDTLKLYLNGSTPAATASRGTESATFVAPAVNSWLGSFNFTGATESKGLDGMLDELAYYDGVLAPEQIQQLFERTITPFTLAPPPPPTFVITSYTHSAANGESSVIWDSVVGESYFVVGSEDLESWIDLNTEDLPGTGNPIEFKHIPSGNPTRYFYRVEME